MNRILEREILYTNTSSHIILSGIAFSCSSDTIENLNTEQSPILLQSAVTKKADNSKAHFLSQASPINASIKKIPL